MAETTILGDADTLRTRQRRKASEEQAGGGKMFMGLPDRWYEKPGPLWRCTGGHVCSHYLGTDRGPRCIACGGKLFLTWPEDEESATS